MGAFAAIPNIDTILAQAAALAKYRNDNEKSWYEARLQAYLANREMERSLGLITAPPSPPLRVTYEIDPANPPALKAVYHDPLVPAWKDPGDPAPPPANNLDIGPAVEDGSGRIQAGPRDTMPIGTVITHNGRRYMRMQAGFPGAINYFRYYAPIL